METFRVAAFACVCVMWVVSAALFVLRKHPPRAPQVRKKGGLAAGLVLQTAGYTLVWAFGRGGWMPLARMPAAIEIAVDLLALLLMVGSIVLAARAVQALGKEWSYGPRLVEGHELKTTGPYGIVRNPIYSGMLGMLVATGAVWSRWEALAGATALFLAGTAVRVRGEEALLRGAFGPAFEEYARRVPALIPRLW